MKDIAEKEELKIAIIITVAMLIIAILIFIGIIIIILEDKQQTNANDVYRNYSYTNSYNKIENQETYKSDFLMGDSNSNVFSSSSNDNMRNAFECAKDAIKHRHLSNYTNITFCDYEEANIEYSVSSWDTSYSYKVSGTVYYYDSSKNFQKGTFNVELQLTTSGYKNAYAYLY